MKNGDMPAMPIHLTQSVIDAIKLASTTGCKDGLMASFGLTKREIFAMAAMQGILSGNTMSDLIDMSEKNKVDSVDEMLFKMSINAADGLLESMEKSQS